MKKLILILFLFLIVTGSNWAHAGVQFDRYLYVVHTGEQLTIAWDAPTETILRTELKLFHYEQNTDVLMPVAIAKIPYGTYQVTFSLPRWGHWVPYVRFCFLSDSEEECTDWTNSTDAEKATVNGTGRAWWLYSHVAPVIE